MDNASPFRATPVVPIHLIGPFADRIRSSGTDADVVNALPRATYSSLRSDRRLPKPLRMLGPRVSVFTATVRLNLLGRAEFETGGRLVSRYARDLREVPFTCSKAVAIVLR